jgi:hypothetical protein
MVSSPFTLQIIIVSGEIFVHCQDPSVSKSNRLHIDIFRFYYYLMVYRLDSFEIMGNLLES